MKSFRIVMIVVAIAGGCRSERAPNSFEAKASAAKSSKESGTKSSVFWSAEFEEMVRVAGLNNEQKAALKSVFENHGKKISAWEALHLDELKSLEKQSKQISDAENSDGQQELMKKLVDTRQEYSNLFSMMDRATENVLSDEEKIVWKGHLLNKRILELTGPLELSQGQKMIVADLANEVAKSTPNASEESSEMLGFLTFEYRCRHEVFNMNQGRLYNEIMSENPERIHRRKPWDSLWPDE